MRSRSVLLLLLFLVLGACPQLSDAAQTSARRQRRVDPFARFRDLEPAPPPLVAAEPVWRLTLTMPPSAGGAIDDVHVYVPIRDSGLAAIDRDSGGLTWFRPITTSLPPVSRDGLVFVATAAGLDAFDAATGADRWTVPLASTVIAPLVFDAGWLITIVEPGEVLAFRAADGAIIWRRLLGARSSHPAVPGGERALFFSLDDSRVVALTLVDGTLLWEQKLPGTLSEPAVARDRVFIGSTDNFFYALEAETGALEWKWRGGGDVIGAAADGDVVYFASLDNIIRAVNRGNGNQRWKKETGTRPVLPPRAFRGIVVVPGLAPAMTVFVGKTGELMGSYIAPGNLIGPPLIDVVPKPFRVSFVTITREGVVEALRSSGLNFREPAAVAFPALPGRQVARERLD